jgi:ankyrin repeat protein
MNRIDQELVVATRENNVPEVRRLLSDGADVNAVSALGYTPLQCACYKGHVQVVKELLDHGADTEVEDNAGWTALHNACDQGHLTAVKALVERGVDILAAHTSGRLPFDLAVIQGHSAVAKYILQEFYSRTRPLPLHELLEDLTWIGEPYSVAPPLRFAHHLNVLSTDDVVEIIEILVERNPTLLSSRDEDGSLPLHVACRRGVSFTVVQFFVNRYEVSVKSVTSEGDLPLILACEIPETSLDTIFLLMKLYPDLIYR